MLRLFSIPSFQLWMRNLTFAVSAVCSAQAFPRSACNALPSATTDPQPKHILGVFPSHNIAPCLFPYKPIPTGEKFKIASADAFDPGAILAAGMVAGAAQFFNSNRPFGQEASGYTRYWGAAYAIGDYFREGIFPSVLHQDPRYFRKGVGSTRSRVAYAVSRVFWTQTDAGGTTFNSSDILGSASEVAVSSLYYANHRTARGASVGFASQIGGAIAADILKEFWPDFLRKLTRKTAFSPSK
jgi:hypothetical protein